MLNFVGSICNLSVVIRVLSSTHNQRVTMAKVELIMPKMGESIIEATILNWLKFVGDKVEVDETIVEIATDKVDSEIPSPVAGVIGEILYDADTTVAVGEPIAIINTEGGDVEASPSVDDQSGASADSVSEEVESVAAAAAPLEQIQSQKAQAESYDRFYSPLVKSIASKEGIPLSQLDEVSGSGAGGRVTKKDILQYVKTRKSDGVPNKSGKSSVAPPKTTGSASATSAVTSASLSGESEIIQMGRMRKMIAKHMVDSKHTSPHVTSFVEADVTAIVNWRNKHKKAFQEKYGEKITFTPIFMEAVAKAIRDFPMINISVDGDNIIVKKDINIGMAAALPSGNLIVPVIKGADQLNLVGLTRKVNDLASRARANTLKPDEVQGGTYTLTNVGTFGNVLGTPIINQPQVAIMAVGAIRKKPAVVETEYGDLIAVRHMMFLSHSYDHRVVDGFLGGSFVKRVADYLESFDTTQGI